MIVHLLKLQLKRLAGSYLDTMPKRQNPFGECSPLQLKSHVSVKDLERTQTDAMNSVYEKTKALLFEGSRKTDVGNSDESMSNNLDMPHQQTLHLIPGQLTLNNNCGISKMIEISENGSASSMSVAMETEASEMDLLPGQTFLDSSGQIQKTNVERASSTSGKKVGMICSLCNRGSSQKMHVCRDCGRDICISCVQQCYVCENPFCRFCATTHPADYLERVICQSCKQQHLH